MPILKYKETAFFSIYKYQIDVIAWLIAIICHITNYSKPCLASIKEGQLEFKEILRVVITNIFNHLTQKCKFAGRKFAIFHIISNQITKNATEILVTRIRQETT